MGLLENKVALITGGGSGIGKATALLFAREGAKIIVSDIDEEKGKMIVSEIERTYGDVLFIRSDSSKAEDHELLVERSVKKYGALDVAVNNAGIGGALCITGEYPIEAWHKVIDTNLSGVFYGMRYQIAAMTSKGGSIVNLASIFGQTAKRLSSAYIASKHGVVGLTKATALEYADKNIRVNAVGPGYIKTPMVTGIREESTLKMLEGLHPLGRLGNAEEVAELILWLASDKSSFVTGAYYAVDGGYLAQ